MDFWYITWLILFNLGSSAETSGALHCRWSVTCAQVVSWCLLLLLLVSLIAGQPYCQMRLHATQKHFRFRITIISRRTCKATFWKFQKSRHETKWWWKALCYWLLFLVVSIYKKQLNLCFFNNICTFVKQSRDMKKEDFDRSRYSSGIQCVNTTKNS